MEFILKYRRFEKYLHLNTIIYLMFLGGFLLGMFLGFLVVKDGNEQGFLWLEHILQYIKYGEIQYGDLLFYVLRRRITFIVILAFLCMSGKGKYILMGGVAIAGGFVGFFVTEFVIIKGILGSALFAVSIFPHYLCYGYSYLCLLQWIAKKRNSQITINRDSQKKMHFSDLNTKDLIKKLAPIAVVIMGILLECYVNPFFAKLFLKIFM